MPKNIRHHKHMEKGRDPSETARWRDVSALLAILSKGAYAMNTPGRDSRATNRASHPFLSQHMDHTLLRTMYLQDLKRAPKVKADILRAAKREDRTVTLSFRAIKDDPMLLYACWGFARLEGVTLILPPAAETKSI